MKRVAGYEQFDRSTGGLIARRGAHVVQCLSDVGPEPQPFGTRRERREWLRQHPGQPLPERPEADR